MFSFSSTRFLVTLSFVVVGFLQQHPMVVQAADDECVVASRLRGGLERLRKKK